MSNPKLRLFSPSDSVASNRRERELDRLTGTADARTVAVPLGKVVPLLLDAAENDRSWLNDFSEDMIRIDADLYEVIMAYSRMQKSSAA